MGKKVNTAENIKEEVKVAEVKTQTTATAQQATKLNNAQQKQTRLPLYEGGVFLAGSSTVDLQASERFRILRAKLERLNLNGSTKSVIAVTSAVPEEGKSLIACNLARSLAMDPRGKTLLIDCDLRKPTVHRYSGVPSVPGLSDVLVGKAPLSKVIHNVENGFDVISAGSPVVDATRAIELPQFPVMLEQLRAHYRYVIIDCPPLLLCPEPLILSSVIDGTVMVVRAWRTEKKLVKDAVNLLGKEKFLGLIVNDAKDSLNEYGYYGYYGYDKRSSKRSVNQTEMPAESKGLFANLRK